MPPLPSKAKVEEDVTLFVAAFARIDKSKVKPDSVLRDPPLKMDDNQLAFLAMSLRGYVRNFNQKVTVTASDTRKSGLKVSALAEEIHKRIHS